MGRLSVAHTRAMGMMCVAGVGEEQSWGRLHRCQHSSTVTFPPMGDAVLGQAVGGTKHPSLLPPPLTWEPVGMGPAGA